MADVLDSNTIDRLVEEARKLPPPPLIDFPIRYIDQGQVVCLCDGRGKAILWIARSVFDELRAPPLDNPISP